MFTSSKRFGPISVGHRQWKSSSHCSFVHGYGRVVDITVACKERDSKGWVMDFGGLKEIKQWLWDKWDHKLLIANDDPLISTFHELHIAKGCDLMVMPEGYGPGIEDSCKYLFDKIGDMVRVQTNKRVRVKKVRIYEHEYNWAEYEE